MKKKCAYCDADGPLTREHLWPAALHRRLKDANGHIEDVFYLTKLERTIPSEPQIKDVCVTCNNGALSVLDDYICHLFVKYFVRVLELSDKVVFKYDYHKLTRWLLKMSFNSARISDSADVFAFTPLKQYILGGSIEGSEYVRIFAQLMYPSVVPASDLEDSPKTQGAIVWKPLMNRAGHMVFRLSDGRQKVLRAVHLRSYSFFVAFFQPGERPRVIDEFVSVFLAYMNKTQLLSADTPRVKLTCGGQSAWESIKAARSKIVFSSGTA